MFLNTEIPFAALPQRLTVAHVVEGSQGGVGTVVRNLIDSQAADPLIAAIHLFADPRRLGDMLLGAPAHWHNYASSRKPWQIASVASALNDDLDAIGPDVVFLHSTFPGVYGRLFRGHRRRAIIYCPHGWAFAQSVPALKRMLYGAVERVLSRRCNGIVSISFSEFDSAVRAGIRPPLHEVIYNGLSPASEVHSEPASSDGTIHLGFVGRFDRQKGLDVLLKAVQDPRLSRFKISVIGASTLGQAPDLSSWPNIEYIGWVPNAAMDSYMKRFDAIVIPSRWEGFGLVALEAMRNGKAVIASRVGGLSEMVIDGVNGRLFEPADVESCRRILLQLKREDINAMGQMGSRIFLHGFQWHHSYARWQLITEKALQLHTFNGSQAHG